LATLAGIWLSGLSNDLGTLLGTLAFLLILPTVAVAVIFASQQAGRLGAQASSKYTVPAVKVAEWCVALMAGALFSGAVVNRHDLGIVALAITLAFLPTVGYTTYLKTVESEAEDPKAEFILLAGISGSGKSHYAKHLEKDRGFHFIETDSNDVMRNEADFSNAEFVRRLLAEHDKVVMEWGFLPQYLGCVLSLKKQGAKLLWFKADLVVARSMYAKAHPNDSNCMFWDAQMQRIREACLPTSDFQIVETCRGGSFRSSSELDKEIL